MNRKAWIWGIIVVIIVAGAGFWGGMTYAATKTPTVSSRFGGAAGAFAARGGASGAFGGAAGGGTVGTVVQVSNGSFTVQLPTSTSTTAATGTKLVLVDSATEVDELETVPVSNIKVGQSVTVAGASNSDGSVTASSVMIRPATTRTGGTSSTGATTPTATQ